jgi:hypothetical protein
MTVLDVIINNDIYILGASEQALPGEPRAVSESLAREYAYLCPSNTKECLTMDTERAAATIHTCVRSAWFSCWLLFTLASTYNRVHNLINPKSTRNYTMSHTSVFLSRILWISRSSCKQRNRKTNIVITSSVPSCKNEIGQNTWSLRSRTSPFDSTRR